MRVMAGVCHGRSMSIGAMVVHTCQLFHCRTVEMEHTLCGDYGVDDFLGLQPGDEGGWVGCARGSIYRVGVCIHHILCLSGDDCVQRV